MSLDIFKLDGRVALITGGNRGLGFAKSPGKPVLSQSHCIGSLGSARGDQGSNRISGFKRFQLHDGGGAGC